MGNIRHELQTLQLFILVEGDGETSKRYAMMYELEAVRRV